MTQVTPPDRPPTRRATRAEVLEQHLPEAERRLVRTVDALPDAAWEAPSGLPGWTRAQVVAHLVLNAEGLAGALRGVVAGEPVPMYRTPESRDTDIDELAAAGPVELRSRLLAAGPTFADAAAAVPDDLGGTPLERTPGDARFQVGDVPWMRWREVEVHHADLAAGPGPADWSPAFAAHLLDVMAGRGATDVEIAAHATDLGHTWTVTAAPGADAGPPVLRVEGTAAALAWWLTGRGAGAGVTATGPAGEGAGLPRVRPW